MVKKSQYIDIEIDKLTNSLENVITGDRFPTDILITELDDFKTITKKEDLKVIFHSYPRLIL